jgi:hypothetical protein
MKFLFITLILITAEIAFSQYVGFGRNKVQYNNFDWHTMSTEHFKIFYYPEMKELAEIGAAYAEESYRIHQQNFNYSLIDTVPIIFYSTPTHFRQTNVTPGLIPDGVGGFFEFVKGRVVIPFDGSLANFKHVIRHELCHVFMTAKLSNILRLHRQSTDRMPPLWFTEGLAEYWSTDWDATAEMILKDAVLNDYLYGLDDWERHYGTFLMYKMGQNALMYIAEKYGREKILLLMENFWMSEDFETVMEKTIGRDYKDFDREWLHDLKKKYFSEFTSEEVPSVVTQTLYSGGFGHKPAYYKDGSKEEIYFIGNETGYTALYKINLKNKNKVITVIEGEKSERFEEFRYFRTGLDISSQGVLAFSTKSGASDALHLYDVKREKLISSYNFDNIVQINSPSFSADGDRLIFSAQDFSGKCDLYEFSITSGKLNRLTNDYYDDRDPDYSPDGKYIVFSSDRANQTQGNSYNLFVYSLPDGRISYLTTGDQIDFSPQLSHDGRSLIYTSTRGGIQNIWLAEISYTDGFAGIVNNVSKQITDFTTAAFDPRWIDSSKAVFASFENKKLSVRIINRLDSLSGKPKSAHVFDFSDISKPQQFNKLRNTSFKNDLRYKKEYSLDIATTNINADPVFGSSAGGILAMSDLLGNEQYYFLVYNNSETGEEFFKSFNIAVSRISLGQRLNYAYGIYHLSGTRYDFGDLFSYFERTYGGYFAMSYPLSFFRRIEASISLANSRRSLTEEKINRRALLLTNSIAYTKDNSIWGPTGPIDGNRFNITLGFTTDLQFGNVNYYTVIFDYRRYFRLTNATCVALRTQFLMNEGKETRRWVLGGSWDLRGWPRFSIRGNKAYVANAELRFPVVDLVGLRFPLGIDLAFPYIRGAAFADLGSAWDKHYKQTYGSVGLGLRVNLFYVLALRYDFGKRIENNLKKFQEGYFHQLFFGWDF